MKKPYGLLTITYNEKHMFPLWWKYYSKHVPPEDIHILDHDSNDGHLDSVKDIANIYHVTNSQYEPRSPEQYEHFFLRACVQQALDRLKREYEILVFCEVDEFLIPDPDKYPGGLKEFLDNFEDVAIRAQGYEIMCHPDEPELDLNKPLLAQRRSWHEHNSYSKTLIFRSPPGFSIGFHTNGSHFTEYQKINRDLILVHMWAIDPNLLYRRWMDRPIPNSGYVCNTIEDAIKKCGPDKEEDTKKNSYCSLIEDIPDKWKSTL